MELEQAFNSGNVTLVVILALFKLVGHLIDKNKKPEGQTEEEIQMVYWVKSLYDMHSVKDADGRPIWYMPNQVGQQQEKIIEMMEGMIRAQNDTAHVLERILDRLPSSS